MHYLHSLQWRDVDRCAEAFWSATTKAELFAKVMSYLFSGSNFCDVLSAAESWCVGEDGQDEARPEKSRSAGIRASINEHGNRVVEVGDT